MRTDGPRQLLRPDIKNVSGTLRSIQRPDNGNLRMRFRRIAPLFPFLHHWNVHEETLADGDRTNNLCET